MQCASPACWEQHSDKTLFRVWMSMSPPLYFHCVLLCRSSTFTLSSVDCNRWDLYAFLEAQKASTGWAEFGFVCTNRVCQQTFEIQTLTACLQAHLYTRAKSLYKGIVLFGVSPFTTKSRWGVEKSRLNSPAMQVEKCFPEEQEAFFVFALGFSSSSNVCVFCTFQAIYFCPGDTLTANSLQTERRMGTESIKSVQGAKLTWVDGFRMTPERLIEMTATRRRKQTNKSMDFFFMMDA